MRNTQQKKKGLVPKNCWWVYNASLSEYLDKYLLGQTVLFQTLNKLKEKERDSENGSL